MLASTVKFSKNNPAAPATPRTHAAPPKPEEPNNQPQPTNGRPCLVPGDPTVCQHQPRTTPSFPNTPQGAVLTQKSHMTNMINRCSTQKHPPYHIRIRKGPHQDNTWQVWHPHDHHTGQPHECNKLLRKEVIQPHLPVRLPCYDLVPIANPTFDDSLPKGLGHRLRVLPTFVT